MSIPISNGWALQPQDAYTPDGRVASRGQATSPVTQPVPMRGPGNIQSMQSAYTVEAAGAPVPVVQDPPVRSAFQGIGRSPGQQWPHMPHVEQYSFEKTTGIGWHDTPPEDFGFRVERAGWTLVGPQGSVMPYYYGQNPNMHQPFPDPVPIDQADSIPYTSLGSVPS